MKKISFMAIIIAMLCSSVIAQQKSVNGSIINGVKFVYVNANGVLDTVYSLTKDFKGCTSASVSQTSAPVRDTIVIQKPVYIHDTVVVKPASILDTLKKYLCGTWSYSSTKYKQESNCNNQGWTTSSLSAYQQGCTEIITPDGKGKTVDTAGKVIDWYTWEFTASGSGINLTRDGKPIDALHVYLTANEFQFWYVSYKYVGCLYRSTYLK